MNNIEQFKRCLQCRERWPSSFRYCSFDGSQLTFDVKIDDPTSVIGMCACGAMPGFRDKNGICRSCLRKPKGNYSDDAFVIAPSANLAGATNRGFTDHRNEDAFCLKSEVINGQPVYALVVCDGVSSSYDAQVASSTAAVTVADYLIKAARRNADPQKAMKKAIYLAHKAVCAKARQTTSKKDPPETTLVAALVQDGTATLGWVGDSRAYYLMTGVNGAEVQLTKDHSVVEELIASGELNREGAMADKRSHMITQCLGAGRPIRPDVKSVRLPQQGVLVLCSDGMWNYLNRPSHLLWLTQKALRLPNVNAGILTSELVEHALISGGADNITVAALIYQ